MKAQKRIRDTRQVSAVRTLFLGAFAALCVSAFASLVRQTVAPSFQIERWIGDLILGRSDDFGWNFGFSALLFEGAAIALIYGSLFRSAHRSGLLVGVHVSIFHLLATVFVLSFTRFGLLGSELGATNVALIAAAHFIYGAVLGVLFDLAATKRDYPISFGDNHFS